MKSTKTCILVADANTAKFFLNTGPGKGLTALPKLNLDKDEIVSQSAPDDTAGRVFDSVGAGRHAIEEPAQRKHKADCGFLQIVMDRLAFNMSEQQFDRVVMVAPPSAMAILRDATPDNLKPQVKAELVKDLTHFSTEALIPHLDDVLAVS